MLSISEAPRMMDKVGLFRVTICFNWIQTRIAPPSPEARPSATFARRTSTSPFLMLRTAGAYTLPGAR